MQVLDNRHSLQQRTHEIRSEFLAHQKDLIKHEMERVLSTIDYRRAQIEAQARDIIRQRVYEVHAIAQNIYEQNRDKSSATVQKMITDALRPVRFNQGTGYYFILRYNDALSVLQAHTPEMEGKTFEDLQDASGRFVLHEIIAKTKTDNEFFHSYLWSKPGAEGNNHQKIVFFKKFEPYNWIIGTGVYFEDIENQTKDALLEQISTIRYGKNNNGYFFVSNWQGQNLAQGVQPELVGTDMWETTDSKGTKTTQKMIALVQQDQGGFLQHWWRKPSTGEERPKITYIRGIRNWQWVIGTGIYTDDIEEDIAKLEKQINQDLYLKLKNRLFLTGFILLLFLSSFKIINRWLLKDFSQLSSFFAQAANEDKEIDLNQLRFIELYQMADSANHMLREKISYQNSMQEEKDRFKALHEASFGGVIMHEHGEILDCNQSLSEITGYSMNELIGMNTQKLLSPESLKLFLKSIRTGYKDSYEAEGLRKNGQTYPIAIRGKSIVYKRHKIRVIEITDISERKKAETALLESERNLHNILMNLPIAIALTDQRQKISFRNKLFLQLFGYNKAELRTIDEWWTKGFPDIGNRTRDFEIWKTAIQKARSKGTYFGGIETSITCKDGTMRTVEVSGIPLDNSLLTAFVDITERKRIEEERQNIEKLKAIGTLAGGIAHDFNNILAAIYGNISLAQKKLEQQHPAFHFIEAAAKSMGTATLLTNQLLTFSKGGTPIKTRLSLIELIKEVVNFNLSGSNVKLKIKAPSHLWLANVDQGQMQQVFANLTINAKQAMPNGGHLFIDLANCELPNKAMYGLDAGKYIRINVSDEGVGIKTDNLNRIFEPYFSTKQTGSGLGLATCYSIITRHGGHIHVSSELSKGTTFTLYLPASTTQEIIPQKPTPTPVRQQQSGKILVMDDEQVIRETLMSMLKELSFNVEACSEGQEALNLYRQAAQQGQPFDLVILDLTIPGGVGGKETTQDILAFNPQAKIIISSGYADDQLMAEHNKYGVAGFVAKPYSLTTLREALNQVLNG
jgi:PAS domain S-box-containing protein